MSHKCSWEMLFFESEDTEVFRADRNKLVASIEKQSDKFITYCLTCFTQTCHLCVSTVVKVSVMKNISWCGCYSLLIFQAKKGTELQFLCTQGTLQAGRVEDHSLLFIRQLHPPQRYIQAILYIYKTDYIMSLTLYTPISECIFSIWYSIHFLMCWQGEFV